MTISGKIISVVGGTGAQGGSVIRSLLQNQNDDFEVRCITRDRASCGAVALQARGVCVIEADGANPQEMQAALRGSWGVFINIATESMDFEAGVTLGINILSAAAAAGVKHVVFSSAPYASKLSCGKTPVPKLDVKAKVEEWGRANPAFETFTPIMASWYLENFKVPVLAKMLGGFPLRKDDEGYLSCRAPLWGGREEVPFISVEDDFGDLVHGIFLNPVRWNRRLIQCNGELMSWSQMVQTFAAVTGKKARFIPYIPAQEMPHFELDSVVDLFLYSQFMEGDYYGNGPSETTTARKLKWAAWKAKGGKGRETLMTVREYFEREFTQ